MEPYLGFLAATAVGVGLAASQLFIARRTGLAPYQATLIATLKDNAVALRDRVDQLEAELEAERAKRRDLEQTVRDLRDTVADLAHQNADLRKRLGMDR